ncbi:FAD binding domain [Balamuthia mandrillaris]
MNVLSAVACFYACFFCVLSSFGGHAAPTTINFNFAGMIPSPSCGPGPSCPEPDPLSAFAQSLSPQARVLFPPSQVYQQILSQFETTALHGREFPALIVRAAEEEDVVKAVNFARENGLTFAVKGGAHGYEGIAVPPFGLLLDLSLMKHIEFDSSTNHLRFQAGIICGDLDAFTETYNRAAVCGNCYTVGSGFLAHGGYGALSRRHGLAIDNIVSIDLVTYEGAVVTASDTENQDLFWAVRGALPNFGVAVSFVVRTHDVSTFYGGAAAFLGDSFTQVAQWVRDRQGDLDFHTRLTVVHAPVPGGRLVSAEVALWGEDRTEQEKADFFASFLSIPGLLSHNVGNATYFDNQAANAPLIDAALPLHTGFPIAGSNELGTDEFFETFYEHFLNIPNSLVPSAVNLWGGAIADVPRNATAFWGRGMVWDWFMTAMYVDPVTDVAALKSITDAAAAALHAVEGATADVYTNWLSKAEEGVAERVYGENLQRLRELKREWDPNNFFSHNFNVLPMESW